MDNHGMGGHKMAAGGHGMLVLGTRGKIYMLHLAMRGGHMAHGIQLILEVDLAAGLGTTIENREFVGNQLSLETTDGSQIYFLDRTDSRNQVDLYTLRPGETFSLSEILDEGRDSFPGDIVRGHFELDDEPTTLLRNVDVKILNILYVQKLQMPAPGVPHPLDEGHLDYLLFGSNGEYFVDHRITLQGEEGQNDDNAFHQVFQVMEGTAERFNFDDTRKALLLEIDGSVATLAGRLPITGGVFPSKLKGLVEDADGAMDLDVEVGTEHYLEILM